MRNINFSSRHLFNIPCYLCYVLIFFSCKKNESISNATYTKPNIILILADDVGYEVLGCNRGQSYTTTAIDDFAQTGTRFTQCHACPNCSPSRVELLTGKYGFRNYTGWGNLNTDQKTFANLLQDAGYKTCVAGKWQIGGGDTSIRKFGFEKYLVFQPFYVTNESIENKYRYKSPKLYENGQFLDAGLTTGKYADDMFADYISNFIDSNTNNPFFIYFPLSLCHAPFSPTPDDASYITWNPETDISDTNYYPSMVKYMDKKIMQVKDKIASAGLNNKTIIIFMGDNGTPPQIKSNYNGQTIAGGKNKSTIYGTHVPLIISCPAYILSNQINNSLIDLSDFLPTISDLANISMPANYGVLDGVSFYSSLVGTNQKSRDWVYFYWNPQYNNPVSKSWVQNENYKLYDANNQNDFFNIITDPYEKTPLSNEALTTAELSIKNKFDSVLQAMY